MTYVCYGPHGNRLILPIHPGSCEIPMQKSMFLNSKGYPPKENTHGNFEEWIVTVVLWKKDFLSNMAVFGIYVTYQSAIPVCKLLLE